MILIKKTEETRSFLLHGQVKCVKSKEIGVKNRLDNIL